MENTKSTLAINLSNQANTCRARRTELAQFNVFMILGMEYLENNSKAKATPISVNISKSGDLTINGLDKELVDDRNIYVYSDKKVTNSSECL